MVNFHWSEVSEGPGTFCPTSRLSLNTKHSQHSSQSVRLTKLSCITLSNGLEWTKLVQKLSDDF